VITVSDLADRGASLEGHDAARAPVEVSPRLSLAGEGLEALAGETFATRSVCL
jgi:hypothetical protein